MRNNASASVIARVEKDLANAKQHGKYSNIDYRVCELQEWNVEPTNLEKASEDTNDEMPWS